MELLNKLLVQRVNLYTAWEKVRNFYLHDALFVDEVELTAFGVNLENELDLIAEQFMQLNYKLSPLKPIPYPKKKNTNNDTGIRQYFNVSIRDQVAWMAFVNVIGPWFDEQMPTWSYGNRLHRTAWIEEKNNKRYLRLGWYRHSKSILYKKFKRSWPLFRRHIYLTVRAMTRTLNNKNAPLNDADQNALDENINLREDKYQLPYLKPHFWEMRTKSKPKEIWLLTKICAQEQVQGVCPGSDIVR